jgi:hypothetical protein
LAESGENEIDEAIDAALQAKSAGEATPALTAFGRRGPRGTARTRASLATRPPGACS